MAAEFAGTFLLVFVAAGADVVEFDSHGTIGHVAHYLAPGLLVMAMIWSLSGISGAHINPAVTFAFILRRCFPAHRIAGYLGAQLAGAISAALLLRLFFDSAIEHAITKPTGDFTVWQAFGIEAMLTFLLVFTILFAAEEENVVGKNAALAVGGIVALAGLAFAPVSGASMNPARSIGPMVASGQYALLWLYVAGPLTGAALATAFAQLVLGPGGAGSADAARGKHAHH